MTRLIQALFLPLTSLPVMLVSVLLTVLISIGIAATQLGIWIGLLVVFLCLPPLFRYQMTIVEDCARGKAPSALGADDFGIVGKGYAFFPLLLVLALGSLSHTASSQFGIVGSGVVFVLAGVLFPASLALLAITRSPLQCINPVAVARLYTGTQHKFWLAPSYFVATSWLVLQLQALPMPVFVFLQIFLMFSLAALCGTLIAADRLVDEVDIPAPIAPLRDKIANDLTHHRTLTLTHAYGFISRGNRDGGFKHIEEEIAHDPDPARAWLWYFERMQRWDEPQHALFFAQRVIRDMLQHGENIPAMKLVMRCCLLNEQFRPFREDLPALIEAAEKAGNSELAAVFKGYVTRYNIGMDKRLLQILCCPISHKGLSLLQQDKLETVNAAIESGSLVDSDGAGISSPLSAALITDDGKRIYPIVDGIPVLLEDAAIGMEQLA